MSPPWHNDNAPENQFTRMVGAYGYTSQLWVNSTHTKVAKCVQKFHTRSVVEREIYWGQLCTGPHFVQLLDHRKNWLLFEYGGEPVSPKNLPLNWKEQVAEIMQALDTVSCSHNDLLASNVLVKDGILIVIDFQWASLGNDMTCGIGLDGRKKLHGITNNLVSSLAPFDHAQLVL